MFGRQRGDADHLNALWDESAPGLSANTNGSDESDLSMLQWLQSRARKAVPSRDFVAHLEQEIVASAHRPQRVRHSRPNSWVARRNPFPGSSGTAGRYLGAAAAVIVIVAVLSAIVSLRPALGPSKPAPTFPALAAASSSPVATVPAIDESIQLGMVRFDECTVAPLPDGYLDGLKGKAAELPVLGTNRVGPDSDDEPRNQPLISSLPPGDQPSSETRNQIRRTIRMLTACRYYDLKEDGPDGRYFALFSDDAHRRESVRSGEGLGAYWIPSSSVPPRLGDARQLDDDHVVAFVQDGGQLLIVLFALEGDLWLTDAILGYALVDSDLVAEAYGDESVNAVEVFLLVEDAPGYRPSGGNALVAGSRYLFVFHNLGSDSRRFVIDFLDIDVTIPSYETKTVTISAPPGEYVFQTFTNGTGDSAANDTCGGMPYPGNVLTFYPELPQTLDGDCGAG